MLPMRPILQSGGENSLNTITLPSLLSSSSADNRHVSTTLDLYVHGASLAPRNRFFINLWRPNAEDVEVTIFMVVYSVFIAGRW